LIKIRSFSVKLFLLMYKQLSPAICIGNHAGGTQPISSFLNVINPQLNADAYCEQAFIIINGPILVKLCQPVLGSRIFRHSVQL